MKNIHFLENDYQCPGSDDSIRNAKRLLRRFGLTNELVENMQIHYQFHLMEKEDVYKIIFYNQNILVTYSMYISGSDRQILSLLASAGRNEIKDIVYIDSSGELTEFLNRNLKDEKFIYAIGCALNTNTILTYDYKESSVKRLKFELKQYYNDCIILEDFDTTEFIKQDL